MGFSFSRLYRTLIFGIVEVVSALIEMKDYDVNGRDFGGLTPLSWAAWKGHEEVVKILLGLEEVTPTSQIIAGKNRSHMALGIVTMEWLECYLRGKRSALRA